jgi:hypothetical protein
MRHIISHPDRPSSCCSVPVSIEIFVPQRIPSHAKQSSRLYDTSPVTGGGTEDEHFKSRRAEISVASARSEQDAVIRKWALMWRSIILSTFDKTYLPYYNYIRNLDLTDLTNLIGDSRFIGRIR